MPIPAIALFCMANSLLAQAIGRAADPDTDAGARVAAVLRARVEASPKLPFAGTTFVARSPGAIWESGTVSGVAVDDTGDIYEIQRGDKADPVLVLSPDGRLLRSWGKGDFAIPHSIRVDAAGNVWTVDAGSSVVIKYSSKGEKLMSLHVGGQASSPPVFDGTTDIAFGPNGHVYITDGYANARVLEYSATGEKLREWGNAGMGPGEFHVPHSIQIDGFGTVYVADRENGRIERFDLDGKYLGEIAGLGRVFSVKLVHGVLWAAIQAANQPLTSGGWIVELDPKTGRMLGHLEVGELGGHALDVTPSGEPVTTMGHGLLWFKTK
ncbi:6-bladed beta-propeller [Granulicella aggregans]|uniref:6-bladed beta-propeller n=1 Tax=Granulicella aggregans TaxID=474949 RepID=UPI0021E0BD81|nr:6-bladed beta-propeller [Granulicella aggregans]